MELKISKHAAQRLADRDITIDDVHGVLSRPLGRPDAGDHGALRFTGYARGKLMCAVVAADGITLVSAFWKD